MKDTFLLASSLTYNSKDRSDADPDLGTSRVPTRKTGVGMGRFLVFFQQESETPSSLAQDGKRHYGQCSLLFHYKKKTSQSSSENNRNKLTQQCRASVGCSRLQCQQLAVWRASCALPPSTPAHIVAHFGSCKQLVQLQSDILQELLGTKVELRFFISFDDLKINLKFSFISNTKYVIFCFLLKLQ